MPRIKLTLPEHFSFTTEIPVRITDLNYGGHVGNDSVLSLIHELRVQFLRHHGYQELDMAGVGLIMADVTIEFRAELFYGETLRGSIAAAEFSRVGFDLYYKLEKLANDKWVSVSFARTGMVCYDYKAKKIAPVPKEVMNKLLS
ncbi:thioesterase family protein [Puia sp.]|jgi:acyl-CoA thioesterase FadM|uniref:acyl-CoA thioesterase n=1 Tax=Puia sp. TaxID=2045100 RepID=UPI002F3F7DD8